MKEREKKVCQMNRPIPFTVIHLATVCLAQEFEALEMSCRGSEVEWRAANPVFHAAHAAVGFQQSAHAQ